MILYVDGGGQVPTKNNPEGSSCYFSFYCSYEVSVRNHNRITKYKPIAMHRFPFKHLSPNLLPSGCSLTDDRGLSTNNIAEYAALFYGLQRFKGVVGTIPITVYQDSQLVVRQVLGEYRCQQDHLIPWRNAIQDIWWNSISLEWVFRDEIVKVLGH